MLQPTLFLRTIAQVFQGCLPIVVAHTWAVRTGRTRIASGLRRGALAAVPLTVVAAWAFERIAQQSKFEASLATVGAVVAACFVWALWHGTNTETDREPSALAALAIGAAAVVIIVRQTMEIGLMLHAAATVTPGANDALVAIGKAIGVGFVLCWMWHLAGRHIHRNPLLKATGAFAGIFLLQIALYAFHEAAEARLLPWSDVFHAATEPYGPDSVFGLYVSWTLLLLPAAVGIWVLIVHVVTDSVTIVTARAALVSFCALIVALASGLVSAAPGARVAARQAPALERESRDIAPFLRGPHLLFRHMRHDADHGQVGLADIADPDTARAIANLSCARVSFGGDRGVCIQPAADRSNRFEAVIFDNAFQPMRSLPLAGTPSRTRTSADGRFGATTMFLGAGAHGYAKVDVSTQTTLFDLQSLSTLGDLEQFTAYRRGSKFKVADFNYWGVTFSNRDSNTFYATLRTSGTNYLVRGNVARRTVTVVAENVECPSLSPDDLKIAFKRREDDTSLASWRIHVLDLATMETAQLPLPMYVDDQVEWIDSSHVAFALPHFGTADVWVAPIDGSEKARILVHDAESPIAVRAPAAALSATH